MTKTASKPKYVNLQPTAVQVYDEKRHPVTVQPWSMRGRQPNATYVVEGAHYQTFVSGRGPLYPFPADPNSPPGPLGETEDARHSRLVAESHQRTRVEGLQASANRGRTRVESSVARVAVVDGETREETAARLRPLLRGAGFVDAASFRQAPRHELLKVAGITEENIARVRELEPLIYAPAPKVEEPTGNAANEGGDDGEGEGDTDQGPYNSYSRKLIDRMGRARLVKVIQDEGFELSLEGTAAELRARLIDALTEYEMLTD